ncbi:MAG: DUF5715 family protein [Bacteroidales bacterium]|nr:DUF5715 family protein [Bacteroidales bacterium]
MKYLLYIQFVITVLGIAACGGIGGVQTGMVSDNGFDEENNYASELLNMAESDSLIYADAQDEIEDEERMPDTTSATVDEEQDEVHIIPVDSMPPGGKRIRVRMLGSLRKVFNDSNYIHLGVARKYGITPIMKLSDAWNLKVPVIRVVPTETYYIDKLTYSLPYLVPRAKKLLDDIAQTWKDSLTARGGGDYRLKVTSMLRTPATIKKLRRRNTAAVDSSAHQYGTTFDISFVKFVCDNPSTPRTAEDLKNLLAEVLYYLREEGRCYVKYEHKQGCFHITTR